jgi:hypothetical protein
VKLTLEYKKARKEGLVACGGPAGMGAAFGSEAHFLVRLRELHRAGSLAASRQGDLRGLQTA